ncbi:TPA: hypothetical protein VBX77_003803 [Yersinia enterocolitica]|nr:hypothetical protein [Yersinia enterocolitica]
MEDGEVVLIKQMKTTIQERKQKLVLQGNESQDIEWKNVHDKQYTFSQKTKAFIYLPIHHTGLL